MEGIKTRLLLVLTVRCLAGGQIGSGPIAAVLNRSGSQCERDAGPDRAGSRSLSIRIRITGRSKTKPRIQV